MHPAAPVTSFAVAMSVISHIAEPKKRVKKGRGREFVAALDRTIRPDEVISYIGPRWSIGPEAAHMGELDVQTKGKHWNSASTGFRTSI